MMQNLKLSDVRALSKEDLQSKESIHQVGSHEKSKDTKNEIVESWRKAQGTS